MTFDKYLDKDVLVVKYDLVTSYPGYIIQVLANDEFATMEFRKDRIRVHYDKVSKLVTSVEIG